MIPTEIVATKTAIDTQRVNFLENLNGIQLQEAHILMSPAVVQAHTNLFLKPLYILVSMVGGL